MLEDVEKVDNGVLSVAQRNVTTPANVLILTPSQGLSGGIERYAEGVESAFAAHGIEYRRADLPGSGLRAHVRLLATSRNLLPANGQPVRIVLLHKHLVPVGAILARDPRVSGVSVICHGNDVWINRPVRGRFENYLIRCRGMRVVAVSGYTAGAFSRTCNSSVLPPGISQVWFRTLTDAASARRERPPGIRLMTTFRLAAWQDKGLPELMNAIAALGRSDIHLRICGWGKPSASLRSAVKVHAWCTLVPGLNDRELAREYADADLFVLATRTRPGARPSGEGFGMSLLEAQIAGTPVVAPAHGGSSDAYVDRVTGIAPINESSESLAIVIRHLLRDPECLSRMGDQAASWARERFAPERYAELALSKLL